MLESRPPRCSVWEPCEPDPGLLDIEAIGLPIQEEVDVYHPPGKMSPTSEGPSIFPDCEEDAEAEESQEKTTGSLCNCSRGPQRQAPRRAARRRLPGSSDKAKNVATSLPKPVRNMDHDGRRLEPEPPEDLFQAQASPWGDLLIRGGLLSALLG